MAKTLTTSDRRSLIRLASTMEKGSPERKVILAGLGKTSSRMGVELFTSFVDTNKFLDTLEALGTDQQSQKLLEQVQRELVDRLTPDSSTERAINRLSNLVRGNQDPANLRNQIFKVANELKISLPSGMF